MANPTPSGDARGQAGYTLAALAIAVTVLLILLGIALPVWSKAIQREKEEELIARGLQYAEAIRVFRARFNRLPLRLEELIEVKPRSIRQLWKDPMTKDGAWGIVFEAAPGGAQGGNRPPGAQGGGQPLPAPQQPGGVQGGLDDGRTLIDAPQVGPDGKPVQTFGPIAGVHSLSNAEAIHVWNGKEKVSEWIFDYTLLTTGGQPFGVPSGQQGAGGGINPFALKAEWLGRPFRSGIVPPGQGGSPPAGGTGPNGQPGGGFGGSFGGGKGGSGNLGGSGNQGGGKLGVDASGLEDG